MNSTDISAPFLIYGGHFNFVTSNEDVTTAFSSPDPHSNMFLLRRSRHTDESLLGDIMSLDNILHQVQLIPKYGSHASRGLNSNNSMAASDFFYLNHFAHKETFHAILSY
jgi:hypothetical protein